MSYAVYDFTETLAGCGIEREQVERVEAAFGENGDCAEWTGGFVVALKDGRRILITGWCDTTGWGCQDGTQVRELTEPGIPALSDSEWPAYRGAAPEWETEPADLNRYIATGEGRWE